MAPAKYLEYFQKMMIQNQELFTKFSIAHDAFAADQQNKNKQDNFNQVGQKVVDLIRDWDRRLCSAMGKGAFSKYSQKLSEKFWGEAQKKYPLIYSVGVKSN